MTTAHIPALILGAGVTGLGAGMTSGCPVFERERYPGGICSSYYMRPGSPARETCPPTAGLAYRFEHGGGHWIFGGDAEVLALIERIAPLDRSVRRSSVFFADERRFVAFPIQHHLHQLDSDAAQRALSEILAARVEGASTMSQWLEARFGTTLNSIFFAPFHAAYTAGLWRTIAPQDGYKTPIDISRVLQGASTGGTDTAGYNVSFGYPREGLDALMHRLAARADVRFAHAVERIDVAKRTLWLSDGRAVTYDRLLSTLPLNRMIELCGLDTQSAPAPYTSVLVVNIGARRGPCHPTDHWLYVPRSRSGFHRVGFYSNVANHFVPAGRRDAASLYVERSFVGGARLGGDAVVIYAYSVVDELQSWGFIEEIEAIDTSWIDVAYTWNRPDSDWVREASSMMNGHGIRLAGRFARWKFQGIAESLGEGLAAGRELRQVS